MGVSPPAEQDTEQAVSCKQQLKMLEGLSASEMNPLDLLRNKY
jgi:hypothetical protein